MLRTHNMFKKDPLMEEQCCLPELMRRLTA